eukprot:g2721.t1
MFSLWITLSYVALSTSILLEGADVYRNLTKKKVSSDRASMSPKFRHGWDTTAEMTFADMSAPKILSDVELKFVSDHYRVFSMEKCSGSQSPNVSTEEFIYSTASRLKRLDPTTRTVFYWATDQQGIWCYEAATTFDANPSWHLKDDYGNYVTNGHGHVLDFTNEGGSEWWISVPLQGAGGRWTNVSLILDGVLADGAGRSNYPNISNERLNRLADAKFEAIAEMQRRFSTLNGGVVMANGISMYPPPNADPRFNDHNLHVLNVSDAIMNEHTCAFESVFANNATYNVKRVENDLDAVDTAATMHGGNKTVFVQTWPGMYSGVQEYPPVANGGEPTPKTNDEWRDALRRHFPFAHALALTVARENVFWFYGVLLLFFGTLMEKQPDFVITIDEDRYDDAPGQIYGAAGIYVALICVSSGFWLWHDFNEKHPTVFSRSRENGGPRRSETLGASLLDSAGSVGGSGETTGESPASDDSGKPFLAGSSKAGDY